MGLAPRFAGQLLQHIPAVMPLERVKQADGIDDRVALARERQDLVQRGRARVVGAVTDDQQHSSERAVRKMPHRPRDRVVQSRASARIGSHERLTQHVVIARKRKTRGKSRPDSVVEIHGEHLVPGVTRAGEGEPRGDDGLPVRLHASAVVDHETHRRRTVFMAEERNPLTGAVLEDGKHVGRQIGDERPASIETVTWTTTRSAREENVGPASVL